jgi:small subunit ribosomal protein S2
MEHLPGGVFVIDPKREELLVKEANRLKIPVLALTDTNCDPEVIDYVIPGNDDAIRSISLISRLVADAIIAGRGEEVQVDERPVPPVIEDSQVEAEALQTAEVTTEAPNGTSAAPPADEPEAPAEPEAIPEADAAGEPEVTVESEVGEEPEAEVVETEVVDAETIDVETVEAEAVDAEAVEAEVIEPEAIDSEAVEPEAATEPEAEEIETEEAGPVEEAPDEEIEETEEKQ